VILGYLAFACVLIVGVVHIATPVSTWRWDKKRAEARGLVFQESPSEQTLGLIQLKGLIYAVLAAGAVFYFATGG
jgi:hypothetical protein